jgi:DNA-binding NarL/FixJ family response regulator
MLVKGLSAKQVAAALGTSEGTVKNQRKAVYKKLGIIRATQLAGAMGYSKAR